MTAPTFDLDALRDAAKAASSLANGEPEAHAGSWTRANFGIYTHDGEAMLADCSSVAVAAHIAAASPAVVLAMCARLRWAERLEAAARAVRMARARGNAWDAFCAVLAEKPEGPTDER